VGRPHFVVTVLHPAQEKVAHLLPSMASSFAAVTVNPQGTKPVEAATNDKFFTALNFLHNSLLTLTLQIGQQAQSLGSLLPKNLRH
jgi:hypothetical protein